MKVYISSTYRDLRDERLAVAKALRRMGHQAVGMEDYVAEGVRPLSRCLDDVATCDAFVGILAWRYGHSPTEFGGADTAPMLPEGTELGQTSMTEFEFRHAVASDKRPLMFLLDPEADWAATNFDAVSGPPSDAAAISALRNEVSQDYLVSFFRSADDLASLVSAAIYRREMDRQMDLESLNLDLTLNVSFKSTGHIDDSTLHEIKSKIAGPEEIQALRIDVGHGREWWSTRLWLAASFACDLTNAHVIVFVGPKEAFLGMATPCVVKERLAASYSVLRAYDRKIGRRSQITDIQSEVERRAQIWESFFAGQKAKGGEAGMKVFVTPQELRRWLGEYLMEPALEWGDDVSSAWQVQRLVDWPTRFVPIVHDGVFQKVVDRRALTDQVARLFIKEQLSRTWIR